MSNLDDLRHAVYAANLHLRDQGLVSGTFGNVSGIDRTAGVVVIKPSGVPYDDLTPQAMVAVDLYGRPCEPGLRPSSDTRTHCALYRAWPEIGGVAHTHSTWATAWAQARRELPCYGTTHADEAAGPVPCAPLLSAAAVAGDYEEATGNQVREAFTGRDRVAVPMVLVAGHGPFAWGPDPAAAARQAGALEHLAHLAALTEQLAGQAEPLPDFLIACHWQRKHGPAATYGQTGPGVGP